MFSLDMTAPSITTPQVRGRRVSMTQSKSYSHGRIYIALFHSSTSMSPLLPPSCILSLSLCSCWCLFFVLSVPLFISPSLFCLDNRNVQSFFNGARNYISSGLVQYCCPLPSPDNKDVCLKRYMAFVLISNYCLSLCLCVSLLFTETIFKQHVISNTIY